MPKAVPTPQDGGLLATALTQLRDAGVPVAPWFLLPESWWQDIWAANGLTQKWHVLFRQLDASSPEALTHTSELLSHELQSLRWPPQNLQALLANYAEIGEGATLLVQASLAHLGASRAGHVSPPPNFLATGETDLIDALVTLLQAFYHPSVLPDRQREWQSGRHLPPAIVVMALRHVGCSGTVTPQGHVTAYFGLPQPKPLGTDAEDHFTLNPANGDLLTQIIGIKRDKLEQQGHELNTSHVPPSMQTDVTLNAAQLQTVMHACRTANQHSVLPVTLHWIASTEGVQITGVTPYLAQRHESPSPARKSSTLASTKQPLIVPSFHLSRHAAQPKLVAPPTVMLLESDTFWLEQTAHPLRLLADGKAPQLRDDLRSQLAVLAHRYPATQVFYRTHSLTGHQRRPLPGGEEFEALEQNPLLGSWGGARANEDHRQLDLELDALSDFWEATKQPIGVAFPGFRHPDEWLQLAKHLHHQPYSTMSFVNPWLELTTPASVLQLAEYLHVPVAGVGFNLDLLQTLLVGAEGERSAVRSVLPRDLLHSFLLPAVTTLRERDLPSYCWTQHPEHEEVALATMLGVNFLIVPAPSLTHAQQALGVVLESS